MRILLIEPAKPALSIGGDDVFVYEPLALEYLAAGISESHEVRILDMRLEKGLERSFDEFDPHIVGITAYTVHVNVVKGLCAQIKSYNERILTVVGGHHATVQPEDFVSPFVDVIVRGEGVFVFKEIVSRFERAADLDGISGVFAPDVIEDVAIDCPSVIDLDALPFPARNLTAKYRHSYYAEWMRPLASIRTSKGCPYRCNFCALWKIAGGRYWKREPEKIVEELAQIEEECVFFADDESLVDAKRMATLARLIREAGIKKRFFLYGRSDTIARNPSLLKTWREIGLERVFVGLESFRKKDLEFYQKNSTTEENEVAVRILQDLGIDVYASFIVHPDFTRQDFSELRRYCRHLQLNFASFAVLTPLPGTDLLQEVEEQLITRNYDLFDFIHTLLPTTLPLKEFYAEYHDLYKKSVAISKQLSFLRKFPLREIPALAKKGRRFYRRLKTAHLDYDDYPV